MLSRSTNIKRLTVLASLCAIAFLVSLIFPFKVSFLTFDLKDSVIAVASLMYGPIAGAVCSLVVPFIEFITISSTGFYGFIMNFLSSAAFSVSAGLVYKYRRTLFGAVIAMISSVFAVTAVMLLANYLITPYYMGVDRSEVVKLIPELLLPFNLIKSIVNVSVTLLIYKPISTAFGRIGLTSKKGYVEGSGLRSVLLMITALIVAVVAVVIFVFVLGGDVTTLK